MKKKNQSVTLAAYAGKNQIERRSFLMSKALTLDQVVTGTPVRNTCRIRCSGTFLDASK